MEKVNQYLEGKGPFLLGLSGGPDSIYLFHTLLRGGYPFQICHINHGWRKESATEAKQLEAMALSHHIPFYYIQLQIDPASKNLEEISRDARLKAFAGIYHQVGAKALLLGHQRDDLAETILKRVFEGAHLQHIPGIKRESTLHGMHLIRPLLHLSKEEIVEYLEDEKISYFTDPTNLSAEFLRGRMRAKLVPQLEESFGKKVKENLLLLGERLQTTVKARIVSVQDCRSGDCLPVRGLYAGRAPAF